MAIIPTPRPILNPQVNFPLCLAPMVGLSHVVLRLILRSYLPADAITIWPTEMLNSRKLPHEDLSRVAETLRHSEEDFLVPQILGNEEEPIARSLARLKDWGASGVDINMGCPVQKALRHNYGVALMGDAIYAAEVVAMARRNTTLPLSVKLRAGPQGDFSYLKDFSQGLVEAGANWLTLHPRMAEQKRRGQADWSQIARLRAELDCPVIGNGDIQTSADVHRMRSETACDMVMAGRALAARPWMLWQLGEELGFAAPKGRPGVAPRTRSEEGSEYLKVLLQFLDLGQEYFSDEQLLRKFRFFVRTTAVWLPFGQTFVSVSTKEKTIPSLRLAIAGLQGQEFEMSERTELRQ